MDIMLLFQHDFVRLFSVCLRYFVQYMTCVLRVVRVGIIRMTTKYTLSRMILCAI